MIREPRLIGSSVRAEWRSFNSRLAPVLGDHRLVPGHASRHWRIHAS
jgi:hypothetical protein